MNLELDGWELAVSGQPGSVGLASGVAVKVEITDAINPGQIDQNSIILSNSSSIQSLAPYLARCGGVVFSLGSLLAHILFAVRELGIPAIVCTEASYSQIDGGDYLLVDGYSGDVWRRVFSDNA